MPIGITDLGVRGVSGFGIFGKLGTAVFGLGMPFAVGGAVIFGTAEFGLGMPFAVGVAVVVGKLGTTAEFGLGTPFAAGGVVAVFIEVGGLVIVFRGGIGAMEIVGVVEVVEVVGFAEVVAFVGIVELEGSIGVVGLVRISLVLFEFEIELVRELEFVGDSVFRFVLEFVELLFSLILVEVLLLLLFSS